MSENLINQYGRTELSLRLAYIKIYLHAGFFFIWVFLFLSRIKQEILQET